MGMGSNLDGCGARIKYILFGINLVICIGGIVAVGIGIWTVVDKLFPNELLGTPGTPTLYAGATYVLIVTGALITLISCFGCFGAIKEVRCMLVTYFIAVFLIFVTMLIGGILAYVYRAKIDTSLKTNMISALASYDNSDYVKYAWDETQARLHCCGVESYRDWRDTIPDSCCLEPVPGKKQRCNYLVEIQNSFTLFQDGCYNVLANYLSEHTVVIGTVGVIVSFLMLLGMIASFVLYRTIDN
jgi:tetraspanin-11